MFLEIISPEQTLFSDEIHLVQLPGVSGSFEIMNNHAPLVSAITKGKIRVITKNGEEKFFDSYDGVVEVKNNKVVILISKL